jgi:hypothetical protein
MFQLSDHVYIVGGVLQEYSVRLDGLHGLITSSRHDAPPGTFAVFVDWADSPYADRIEELPKWVNVPPQFLRYVEDDQNNPEPGESTPREPQPTSFNPGGLRLVD